MVFFNIENKIKIIQISLPQKNPRGVFKYMPDEQDMIWLKGMQLKLKGCEAKNSDMKFLIKLMQDELNKTKQYIHSECRRPDFEYSKHVDMALSWTPRKRKRIVTQIKNEIKT